MIVNTNPSVINSPLIAFQNLFGLGSLTATNSAAGTNIASILTGYTTDPWQAAATPCTVQIDIATSFAASVLCIAAHDLGTKGITFALDRFVTGSWVQIFAHSPADNDPLMISFPSVSASQWRVRFVGPGPFKVGVMVLAPGLTIPGLIVPPHTPLHRVSEYELIGGAESGTGEFLQADTMRTGGKANLTMSVQSPGFATGAVFEQFRQHFNQGKPFFIACFPTYEPNDMGYCWRNGGNIIASYSDPVFMALSMDVGVYVVR